MNRPFLLAICLSLLPAGFLFAADTVTVSEQQVVIPTYLIGPPDPNPQFYSGGSSQGAQHRIYPYAVYDNLTTEKADKSYKMVYLENQYIKVGILPEIGGKIFEAIDKTNGYNFFYHQHVIKPALISLLGAWISGGVEWDVPHHHRATSFLPMQYSTESLPDGGKTVWVGELELRDRMLWTVGISLHPGKSYLEASFRMINRTPVPASMLCFSNVAVSTNDTYQVIFPPSTQHVTYHAKREFTTWPIATTVFNGQDFTAGVDVSWIKNHSGSMSMFAWNYQDDFLAGYDHGKNAGTMAIADHNVVPGKKFFTWGNGPAGQREFAQLTDDDGPYAELMVGAYSDNQPDYTWLQPYEMRSWTQYWYPFRDIDGAKNANTEAAVNLEVKDGSAKLGFYSTSDHPKATAVLKLKDQVLLSEDIAIDPGHPFVSTISIPAGTDEHDLRAALVADGRELVAYSLVKLEPEAMPKPVTPPADPSEIKTNEELYLTGLRIEQFHAPGALPDPYWQEALKRDPGDIRVNTAMAIDDIKAAKYAEAEARLRKALERATDKYTSPKDGEPFYYLGLALKGQGKTDEAFTQFYKATWSAAWRSPGYFSLAEIAAARGDWGNAQEYVERSLNAEGDNVRALSLKAAILRHEGRNDEAVASADRALANDPLDVEAMAQRYMAAGNSADPQGLIAAVNEHPTTALEVAADCMNAGLWADGSAFLTQYTQWARDRSQISPQVYYYLEYFAAKEGQTDKVTGYAALAAGAPADYVFPFQREMADVLQSAMAANPGDSRAPYYLGNFLYDWQPDQALALWEKSAAMGCDVPVLYRNLALAYGKDPKTHDKELAALETAVKFGGNAMVFNDLDRLDEENGVAPDKRLELMDEHQTLMNRDDVISREINLDIFAGKYDAAIDLLKSRFFRSWEGGGRFSMGDSWINANLLKGRGELATKQFAQALADFQAAQTLPANLQDGGGNSAGRQGEISYWIGVAYEGLGDKENANKAWQVAAAPAAAGGNGAGGRGFGGGRGGRGQFSGRGQVGGIAAGGNVAGAAAYYEALAMQKLGQAEKAAAILQKMANDNSLDGAAQNKADATAAQRQTAADKIYLGGLGNLGLGKSEQAKHAFAKALEICPDHIAAEGELANLK